MWGATRTNPRRRKARGNFKYRWRQLSWEIGRPSRYKSSVTKRIKDWSRAARGSAALSMHTTSRARMVLVGGQPKNHCIFKIMSGYTVTREQLCEAKRNDFPCELVVLPVVGAAQSSESIRVS